MDGVAGPVDMPKLEEAERTAKAAFDTTSPDLAAKEEVGVGVGGVDAANLDDNYFAPTPDTEAEAAAEVTHALKP